MNSYNIQFFNYFRNIHFIDYQRILKQLRNVRWKDYVVAWNISTSYFTILLHDALEFSLLLCDFHQPLCSLLRRLSFFSRERNINDWLHNGPSIMANSMYVWNKIQNEENCWKFILWTNHSSHFIPQKNTLSFWGPLEYRVFTW